MEGHGIYGDEQPTRLQVASVLRRVRCPASSGTGSLLPTAQLDRWKAVYESIVEWYRAEGSDPGSVDEIEDRIMGWLDPVQREVTSRLFTTYRMLLPRRPGETVDLDPAASFIYDAASHASLSVAVQVGLDGPNGRELIRLKTGRRATTPEEAAVLHAGSDDDVVFFDALLAGGSLEEIEVDPVRAAAIVAELFAAGSAVDEGHPRPEPGMHCYSCPRPARCGQYPVADGGTVGARTRTVVISKSALRRLPECERRVAWRRLYAIPDDDLDEEEFDTGAAVGSAFHVAVAAALLADDPAAVMEDAGRTVAPSERAELALLWDRHRELTASEPAPVEVSRTEFGLGVTTVVPGLFVDSGDRLSTDAPVAVVFIAFADAVGREPDGTAAVVEHRTGSDGEGYHLEAELYALGAALLLGTDRLAVHTHRLRVDGGPACDRRVFDADALLEARNRLRDAAATVAAWHPHDAMSASYTVGPWCTWCPFENRCARFRDDGPATSRLPG